MLVNAMLKEIFCTPSDVCSMLNISLSTLTRYRKSKSMEFPKPWSVHRKRILFFKGDIED